MQPCLCETQATLSKDDSLGHLVAETIKITWIKVTVSLAKSDRPLESNFHQKEVVYVSVREQGETSLENHFFEQLWLQSVAVHWSHRQSSTITYQDL